MSSQEKAIEVMKENKPLLITAPGGYGKTYTINSQKTQNTVTIAPTGISALSCNGETANSMFMLPYGPMTEEDKFKVNGKMRSLFSSDIVDRLVFDEGGMLGAYQFDAIDQKLRYIRKNDQPFGGIPIVISADMYQLEPIVTRKDNRIYRKMGYKSQFIFDSKVWQEINPTVIELDTPYRQSDLKEVALLNSIRTKDKYFKHAIERLNEWCYKPYDEDTLHLCSYNDDAARINKRHLDNNPNTLYEYKGKVTGKFKVKDCIVDEKIYLKVGMRIILCGNDREAGYVNGERGVVTHLTDHSISVRIDGRDYDTEVVPFKWESLKHSMLLGSVTKIVTGSFIQFPIKQANAITIHKSQSLSLSDFVIDFGYEVKSCGAAYTSLSRATNLKNIRLVRPLTEEDVKVSKRVQEFYDSLKGD